MMCARDHIDSGGSPRGIPPHASEPSLSFFTEMIGESGAAGRFQAQVETFMTAIGHFTSEIRSTPGTWDGWLQG